MMEIMLKHEDQKAKNLFIREHSNEEFITYAGLAAACGMTTGNLVNEGSGWLEFLKDGVTLMVPKKGIRSQLSYVALDEYGCVHGEMMIQSGGKIYKVRLLRGADEDPCNISPGYNVAGTRKSEWNQLFYPIVKDDPYIDWEFRNPNAPYTNADLGFTTNFFCIETSATASTNKLARGSVWCSRAGTYAMTNNYTWRPCLEMVP